MATLTNAVKWDLRLPIIIYVRSLDAKAWRIEYKANAMDYK